MLNENGDILTQFKNTEIIGNDLLSNSLGAAQVKEWPLRVT